MKEIIIRDIKEKDMPLLKSLIIEAFGDGWNLGQHDQRQDYFQALMEVYLSIFLNSSTFGKIAEFEGKAVGAVLASANEADRRFRRFQNNIAANTLALLTAPEAKRMDIVEHLSQSFQAIGQLLENMTNTYDGSLEFIAVSKQAQGLKIGKMLWDEAVNYFQSQSVKSIYLISDSACNTGFYDHNGFSKIGATATEYNYTTGQKKSNIFVYEYLL